MCKACSMSTSAPGSSKCHSCPSNTLFNEVTENCVACNKDEFAYPGDKSCRQRRPCITEYDAIAIYSKCVDNKKTIEYKLRENSICKVKDFVLPSKKTGVECKLCSTGTYIKDGECIDCPEGKYSIEYDSNACIVCPQGYYAPKSLLFADMEKFPEEIKTTCKQAEDAYVNPCDVHKGWVVYNRSIRVPPYLPKGTILAMSLPIEIKGNVGQVEFIYTVGNNEELSFVIDGDANEIVQSNSERTERFDLTKGKHILEWVYKRTEEKDEVTHAMIKSISVTGTVIGLTRQCLKCPKGFITEEQATECTQCPLGMIPNTDSASFYNF